MPRRIYDISKKLGLDNKVIIAKAKSLNITTAKVASSSIDNISADYLEEELIKDHPEVVARLAPKPVEEKPKTAPVEEKIILITAPPEPEPEPVPEPTEIVAEAPVVEEQIQNGEPATPPEVEAPKIPPTPPVPVGPKVGDKVGFIQLAPRPQPRGTERPGQAKSPPPRPGAPPQRVAFPQRGDFRGGQGQRPQFGGRPGMSQQREPAKPAAPQAPRFVAPTGGELIIIKPPIVVRELATQLKQKPFKIIADLMGPWRVRHGESGD
ncbi:MAG: hypothetical protein WDN00_09940 [Limisphaerales bacterium]